MGSACSLTQCSADHSETDVFAMIATVLGVALALLVEDSSREGKTAVNPSVVSGIVGGCLCPGWWTVGISGNGRLSVKVVGEPAVARLLSPKERQRMVELLKALPTSRSHYEFGIHYVDASVAYELKVKDGDRWRGYVISSDLRAEESTDAEVKAIADVWRYLRTLFTSTKALAVTTAVKR
jgi:hypothetical protein